MNKTKDTTEAPRAKPVPLSNSMNLAADAMEQMLGALNTAEDVCMRLTGSCPKPPEEGVIDRGSIAPAEGSSMSLADVAKGQRETFKALAVRFELVIEAINAAI